MVTAPFNWRPHSRGRIADDGHGSAVGPQQAVDVEAARAARRRLVIDRSCRVPCLVLFCSAVVWLLAGTLLAMIASFKLHEPRFLADFAPLTFGRIRPAHLNVVAYGWAFNAALASLLWIKCRLAATPLRGGALVLAGAGLWNVGVLLGTLAILTGRGHSTAWLEFPVPAAAMLYGGFALVAIAAVLSLAARRVRRLYVSQWYLLGALLWFPWCFTVAFILLMPAPVGGVTESAIGGWYTRNLIGLWFSAVGVAIIYYLLPKLTGRPLYSHQLALLGFWALAVCYPWTGMRHLIAGPLPAWAITVSIAASVMLLIPLLAVTLNFHKTIRGRYRLVGPSPTLRFIVFAAVCYLLVGGQGVLLALRSVNEVFSLTHTIIGHAHLGMYGFFTMAMFGAMYYIIPRLTGREWASVGLIRIHFWCVGLGLALMVGVLTAGGIIQGLELNRAAAPLGHYIDEHGLSEGVGAFLSQLQVRGGAVDFLDVTRGTIPWLELRTLSGMMLLAGHIAFAVLVGLNVAGHSPPRPGPMLLSAAGRGRPLE